MTPTGSGLIGWLLLVVIICVIAWRLRAEHARVVDDNDRLRAALLAIAEIDWEPEAQVLAKHALVGQQGKGIG